MTIASRNILLALSVCVLLLILLGTSFAGMRPVHAERPIPVRWLLAHEPSDLYTNAIQAFSDTLTKESDGGLTLEVVRSEDTKEHPNGVPYREVLARMAQGHIELSSTFAVDDGETDNRFWAVNLPFLFSSYDDALSWMKTTKARSLLEGLSDRAPYRALAYTLSGGFRVVASDSLHIRSAEDLAGKRIATSGGPVAEATLEAFGAIPVVMDQYDSSTNEAIDGAETTYTRIAQLLAKHPGYAASIIETEHSLFLTTIIVSDAFYDSLSPKNRRALDHAAEAAAAVERRDSIALARKTRADIQRAGGSITALTPETRAALEEKARGVALSFKDILDTTIAND